MSQSINNQKPVSCSAALLTPRGRGAVATIRVSGELNSVTVPINACFNAANQKPLEEQPLNRIVYGLWGQSSNEDLVICRLNLTTVDIHCHGGMAAVDRILSDLEVHGCLRNSWEQLAKITRTVLDVELEERLAAATTFRTAEILLRQSEGLLKSAFEALLPMEGQSFDPDHYHSQIQNLLCWEQFGLHLTTPWRVVLAGRPNVGKSSLINTILGYERSIVFNEAGTTRDVLTASTAVEGWPIQFSDTAGIREQADALETTGIQRAEQMMNSSDCNLILIDISQPEQADDQRLISLWPASIIVAHKSDLPQNWKQPLPHDAISVSSMTKSGIDILLDRLIKKLVPEVPDANTPVPVTSRQTRILHQAMEELNESNRSGYTSLIQELLS
ncbi:GTPase [Gimesia algae]|uniref:tRNA modification GTPase MnmE n=1 Tax=Gimesia algae TaxID=2527971 RepID=A0A517VEF2_9PLAN|nr:GTPase [Gimesia algae]QDT91383.1 tRNA modification GTPase MnmE [Gimesia algae]